MPTSEDSPLLATANTKPAQSETAAVPGLSSPSAPHQSLSHPPTCANCATVLHGEYCSHCGQHVADLHRSLWRLVGDLLDNLFSWDNKFLRTLGPLLGRPGLLTREYLAGHRMRYVQPLRLFLFVSAVCLTLLQFGPRNAIAMHVGKQTHAQGFRMDFGDRYDIKTPTGASPAPLVSANPTPPEKSGSASPAGVNAVKNEERSWIDQMVEVKLNALGEDRLNRELGTGVQQRLSWVALVMLPFFALLLRACYWHKDSFYFAHLIFSLHYHTFLLVFSIVFMAWDALAAKTFLLRWLTPFNPWLLWVPVAYLFVALRRVYGGSVRRTLAKVFVIGSVHVTAVLFGVGILALFTVLTAER